MTDRSKGQPFDERAALDALEQFQSEIERYRREREAVTKHFEEFVRTLPPADDVFPAEKPGTPPVERPVEKPVAPPPAPATAAPPAPPAAPPPAPPAASAVAVKPPQTTIPQPPPPQAQQAAASRPAEAKVPTGQTVSAPGQVNPQPGAASTSSPKDPVANIDPRPPKTPDPQPGAVISTPAPARSKAPLFAALLVIVLVIAAAVAYWNANRVQPIGEPAAGTPAVETPPPGETAPQTPAAAAPAPAPEPPPTTGSEITTLRPVWVRVIADGTRVVERELPAGAKVPFTAEKTVVIRAGDAGAVRLILRGADHGTLGRDGDVVTRTFTIQEENR